MTAKKTPTRLTDRTNLPPSSSTPSSSSSSSSKPRPTAAPSTASSWRQTSLASWSLPRPSSPPAASPLPPSTPASAAPSALFAAAEEGASGSRRGGTSSPATRVGDEDEDCEMEDVAAAGEDEADERRLKRRRVAFEDEEEVEGEGEEDVEPVALWRPSKGKERMAPTFLVAGRQVGAFEAMRRRELGFRGGRGGQVSMRPWIQTMVSSNEEDVTRIPSIRSTRNFAPPFALAFTNAAKAGGRKIVAVADEEGSVSFLSAEKDRWTRGPTRHSFQAHDNAVFDLRWSMDDQLLATASGDQTVRLWDVPTQTCVGILSGHTCTVKNLSWDPHNPHMLSTASRDGSIRVWDRRVQAKNTDHGELAVGTVNQVKNAHGVKGKGGSKGRSATRSVTAVTYLAHQPNLLASSGSADSVIKIWDLRRSHSRRVNPQSYDETNEDAVSSLSTFSSAGDESGPRRPHGIASMALAPDGKRVYALSTDSSIYSFTPLSLSLPTPLQSYTSPLARYGSFYVRCAVSPCSRFLAAGSSDGGVLLWDTEGSGKDAVRVRGHEREVSGLDWCAGEGLATCSDDHLVRFWHPNQRVARLRRGGVNVEDEEEYEALRARERWSGEQGDE
ncbi:hypothetical protein JCM6882_000765 [Rhodosporidiobolus microsporus]